MPVMAKCGSCGKQYRMRDELAGQILPCKECGANIRVPGGATQPARPAANRPAARQRPARPAPAPQNDDLFEDDSLPTGGGSGLLWIIGGVTTLVLVGGIVLAVVLFTGGDDDEPDKPDKKVAKTDVEKTDALANNGNPLGNNGGIVNPPINRPPINRPPRINKPPVKIKNKLPGGLQPPPPDNDPPVVVGNKNPPNGLPGGLIPANGNGAGHDFADSNPVGWKVEVDPPKETIPFADKEKLTIIAPKSFGTPDALYPTHSSNVVAVGSNGSERSYRDVYDLRTKKKIGQISRIKLFFHKGALSPDGKFFAAMSKETKGIWLWDVVGKKPLGTLPLDEKTTRRLSLNVLDFAGTDRLIAAGRDTPLWVWSIPEGKALKSITLPKSYSKESIACSPGGRYLAVFNREFKTSTVHAIDLTTGKNTGRIELPEEFGFWDCKGLAFSPDGEELAGIFNIAGKSRLFAWNVKNGRQVVQHSFEKSLEWENRNYKGPGLQWFPDKSKWLAFGNNLIDRETGGPVWFVPKIPNVSSSSEARVLDGDRIAVIGTERSVTALATLAIPHEEIAKGKKVIAAGGSTADVGLPPLKKSVIAGAKRIAVDGVAGGWRTQPDPAPKQAAPLAGAMNLDPTAGRIQGVLLSRRDAARAMIFSEISASVRRRNPNIDAKTTSQVDLYDVAGKKKLTSVPFNYDCVPLAFSPSGKYVVMRYKKGDDRLDVWSLEDKKHTTGWRPYREDKSSYDRYVEAAAFVDDNHVLTVNRRKKLVLWKLPECKAVYVMENVSKPGLSPNNKSLVVLSGRSFRFFDALTGNATGDINLGTASPQVAAFHTDGERIAITFVDTEGSKLGVWNLKDGKKETEFPMPTFGTKMHWCGDNHLLVSERYLVDVKNKNVVWSYTLSGGVHSSQSPDGRHWYLSGRSPITLTAAELPGTEVKAHLAGKTLAPKTILKPGMKVSLNIQLNGIAGHPNLVNEVGKAWTEKLKARGIEVAQNQPIVLFARSSLQATGKTKEYVRSKRSRFGIGFGPRFGGRNGALRPGEQRITLTESVIDCRIVFGLNGKAYGEKKMKISNLISGVSLKEGEDAQTALNTRMANSAAGYFRSFTPPAYVYEKGASDGFGTSRLVSGGAQILRKK